MIPRYVSLRQAARECGIGRKKLAEWLDEDGYVFPAMNQGSRALVREDILKRTIELRAVRHEGRDTDDG